MASSYLRISLSFVFWALLLSPAVSQCSSQTFSGVKSYPHCLDLPDLKAILHYSYDSSNTTLSVVFSAPPSKPGGWIAWAINPTSTGMVGSQALVASKDPKTGVPSVTTLNIVTYSSLIPSKLSFEVWDVKAEEVAKDGGALRIFAKVKVPADLAAKGKVNQVWQVGPGVTNGRIAVHELSGPNLNSMGALDLTGATPTVSGGGDEKVHKRNIHGILNALSWGILFPIGAMIARYMKIIESADPAWFYLHVFCQVSAYGLGVAGWATGLRLGSESKGIQYNTHRNIGITLFSMATLQMFALLLRPKKDHKYRYLWNIYHHGVGYSIIILGIINVFKGLSILNPKHTYKTAYIAVIGTLGGITLLLEVVTWVIYLKKNYFSNSPKSSKP
ncbi:hypothetical protein CARUB_v10005017mg [Capsella rubella]|uniref:Cytochrome b561 and DOMON domain-containing protein n=1 Tax=Capsella rubella TaxID=81985 RepID=R0H022_9BRAS|nr:cytochrome b561 and DOMON domain-containing protein At4g12980 [Capsella rubella]EOA16798.1 hypothetical protein CARUB_v10005017mg [Capsella rubella]